MSTTDILFDLAPEFYTVDATELARIERFIGYATLQMDATTWNGLYTQGVVLLAAHKLKKAEQSTDGSSASIGGPVTSDKVGDWSRSYGGFGATLSAGDSELASTTYGQEYLRLREMLVVSPYLVSGDVPDYTYES